MVWISEVEAGTGSFFDGRVAMELCSVISCNRSDSSRLSSDQLCCSLVYFCSGASVEFSEYDVAGCSFDETQQAWSSWTDYGVDFPMSDLFPGIDRRGSCGDVSFASKASTAVVASVSLAALFLCPTEVSVQGTSLPFVLPDVAIDGFMADLEDSAATQVARNLFWTPLLFQQPADSFQVILGEPAVTPGARTSATCIPIGELRAVSAVTHFAVTLDLTDDGAAMSAEDSSDV